MILGSLAGQNRSLTGIIRGSVEDADTHTPLIGANVMVVNSELGAATDLDGHFIVEDVSVGNYTVQISYLGYNTVNKTDIVVRSNRPTNMVIKLQLSAITDTGVVVTAGFFQQDEVQPLSATNFSYEEIRRAPGAAGDVSRMIMSLPSLAKVNDQSNALIVRGGSPIENSFFIDNIEIPNINHFPTQGASGGAIGILNVDFIQDVDFYSGGFSSQYGDRLSSIMNISFREGNRNRFNGQLDLNMAGFGGVFEGPLGQNGSWLFSARRSFLDFLISTFDLGTSIAPVYGDIQGKAVYDLSAKHKLTLLGIYADSHANSDKQIADENQMIYYGNQDIIEQTYGITWRALWNEKFYSNTSISFNSSSFNEIFFETVSQDLLLKNQSNESIFQIRNVNFYRVNEMHSFEMGFILKSIAVNYDNYYGETYDPIGNPVPGFQMQKEASGYKAGLFLNYIVKPWQPLTMNLGLRVDHFDFNSNTRIAPRLTVAYKISERTTLNAAAGMYYQNLPLILMAQNDTNKDLDDLESIHYILGVNHLLTENPRLTLEVYLKDYKYFPLDPDQSGFFVIDELYYNNGFFAYHPQLNDKGKAISQGIELTLQKKLAADLYGLVSGTYFQSRYSDESGKWRDRVYDNRFIFSAEGGYKPNSKWEFSARWIYAGGSPYTPFDEAESQVNNRGILDQTNINGERYPDYHSLNIRADRRFNFNNTNLVLYLSIWNVYDRKNIASYFWNGNTNSSDTIYQYGMLPIFGIEYEF